MHLRIHDSNVIKTTTSPILILKCAIAIILLLVLYYVLVKISYCYCPSNAAVSPDAQNVNGGRIARQTRLLRLTKQERRNVLDNMFNFKICDTSNNAADNNDIEGTSATLTIEDKECPICMDEYVQGDEIINGRTCNHVFHKECLLLWLVNQRKDICPCCRIEMFTYDEYIHHACISLGDARVSRAVMAYDPKDPVDS